MNKSLKTIAGLGFGLALFFFVMAYFTYGTPAAAGESPAVQADDRMEWAWDGGDRVEIAVPGTVHYSAHGAPRVVVRGPAALLKRVRYDHGELKLDDDSFFHHSSREGSLDVTLTGMTLRDIHVAGSSDVHLGEIHQDRLVLSIAGSGSVEASGNADVFSLNIAGSGRGHLSKLAIKTLELRVAGSGQVDAASPEKARISVMGSGDVHFIAMPKDISTNIMGSGRVSDDSGHVISRRRHG